jgi:hypothetical protein
MTLAHGDRRPARAAAHFRVARAKAHVLPAVHGWMIAALASGVLWLGLAKLLLALVRL